jgi:hypothetical protein
MTTAVPGEIQAVPFSGVEEDAGAVITTVEGVVNQAVGDQSRLSCHAAIVGRCQSKGKRKMN